MTLSMHPSSSAHINNEDLSSRASISLWAIVPLLGALMLATLVHGTTASLTEAADDPALGLTRQVGFGTLYITAVVMAARRARTVFALAALALPWLLLISYATSSVLWSLYPVKVGITAIHYVGVTAVTILASLAAKEHPLRFLRSLALLLLLILFGSAAVSMIVPSIGVLDGIRWRGLTMHPNTLGATSLVAVWTGCTLIRLSTRASLHILPILTMVFAIICLVGSNSVTSTVLSAFVIGSLLGLHLLDRSGVRSTYVKAAFLSLFMVLAITGLVIAAPQLLTLDGLFQLLGRDRNFTGRTDIWEQGFALFQIRPWTGWSFDDLLTARAISGRALPIQFHSGFIHAIATAGIIGCILLTVMLLQMSFTIMRARAVASGLATPLAIGIVTLLIHNVTEASFLRPTNFIWMVMLLFYFLALALSMPSPSRADHRVSSLRRRESGLAAGPLYPSLLKSVHIPPQDHNPHRL